MLTISYSRIFLLFLSSLPYSPLSNNIKKNKRYCRPPATTNIVLKSRLKPQTVFTLVVFLFSLLYSCFSFVMYEVFFSISFDDCFTKWMSCSFPLPSKKKKKNETRIMTGKIHLIRSPASIRKKYRRNTKKKLICVGGGTTAEDDFSVWFCLWSEATYGDRLSHFIWYIFGQ